MPFNSSSILSRRWEGDNESGVQRNPVYNKRIKKGLSNPAGLKLGTARSLSQSHQISFIFLFVSYLFSLLFIFLFIYFAAYV